MGIFGSKYVHHVGTAVQRVVEEKDIVDPYKLAIIQSLFSKVDLVDNLLETSLTTIGVRAETYYNTVKKNYPAKMPKSEVVLETKYSTAARAYLQSLYGSTIGFVYNKFGPKNAYHAAWERLIAEYKLDPKTGKIGALSDDKNTVGIIDITFVLPKALKDSVDRWETDDWLRTESRATLGYYNTFHRNTPAFFAQGVVYSDVGTPTVLVKCLKKSSKSPSSVLVEDGENIVEYSFSFALSDFNDGAEYFQVMYSNEGVFNFWTYKLGSGIASLDGVLTVPDSNNVLGAFYPNTYFRLNKNVVDDSSAAIYKKMARRLGINYKEIAGKINENPDVKDVQSALLNLGLPADTTNALELGYIFQFFNRLYDKTRNSSWNPSEYLGNWDVQSNTGFNNPATKQAIFIQDDVFKYALTFEKITKSTHAGTIGPIGFAASGTGEEIEPVTEEDLSTQTDYGTGAFKAPRTLKYRYYRKQVSMSFWEEVRIYELTMVYTVAGEYKATLGDDAKEVCLIPIDRSLIREYSVKEQHELFTRSFNFIFNSYVIQKIKWYQRGIFKVFLIVVAVVVMLYTGYGATFLAELTAAAAGGAAMLGAFLVKTIVVSIAIQVGFKLFVKLVGPELAFLVALVAACFGMMGQNIAMLTPADLMKLGTNILTGVGNYFKDKFKDLAEEMDSFLSLQTEAERELNRATDLLEPQSQMYAPVILGESPTDFIHRNTVFVCSGFTELNNTSQYSERALQLPTGTGPLDI